MRVRRVFLWCLILLGGWTAGCRKPVYFPAQSLAGAAEVESALAAYDTDSDGTADFFTYADGATGRIVRIGYDLNGDGRADVVNDLDAIPLSNCRHLVIILDGIGYDLVRRAWDDGRLRMFHPPSRVIAPYPTVTDPSLEDVLGNVACRSIEAVYFDHQANRLAGGTGDYLAGKNQPYNQLLDYRADLIWDAIGYLMPWEVFGKEINDAKRRFDKTERQEFLAYFVSAAGVGTTMGAEGQKQCLERVEQLVNQVIWETRGLTKVTLLADHGHTYTPARRIQIETWLKEKGWRLRNSLKKDNDVALIRYGLVTYAALATLRPAALASDVVKCEGVELASYVERDSVVVLAPGGQRAIIGRDSGRFRYQATSGDPLKLLPVLANLGDSAGGYHDADRLLEATAEHVYPAPLQRLWRAHFGLVKNPPDVLCSLKDDYFFGSAGFSNSVNVVSTHGGLNRTNSTTFIMSTVGPLPPLMRSGDIPRHMSALVGRPWPMRK